MRLSHFAPHFAAALLLSSGGAFQLAGAASIASNASNASIASAATPLVIGESFSIDSRALNETRHINVYMARAWDTAPTAPLPVLYMPDGGVAEDFLHVAGLLQVSVANGTMRPFMLVGIENTQRRRDLTGPTENADDRKIAAVVGGAPAYRAFLRDELMPEVRRRYRTTGETAIVGESLGGLFVVETYLLEPQLFDHYLAFDPSLWWNHGALPRQAAALMARGKPGKHSLYLASSSEAGIASEVQRLAQVLETQAPPGLQWHLEKLPDENHGTIYHPAALKAFRAVFKPQVPAG